MKKVLILLFMGSFLIADDRSDIEEVIHDHWLFWNANNFKDYISTVHSEGTMNGDSNGSFWYYVEELSVKVLNDRRKSGDKSNFTARYIDIDILVPGKAAVAYYYLVGSFTMGGVTKNDYRTRVSQVFVSENKEWKIKGGHFSPLHGGSGILD
tara:strand:+ start:395 stop:853 length:459 start_codon:yes stop_codon:yes gene_type:complete